jgi:hypothetical protein
VIDVAPLKPGRFGATARVDHRQTELREVTLEKK